MNGKCQTGSDWSDHVFTGDLKFEQGIDVDKGFCLCKLGKSRVSICHRPAAQVHYN
jgi:hypothetical protein